MRFADLDGSMIDVYQANTEMTDESGQAYPATSNALLDNALGPQGYYGLFVANIHTDQASSADSDNLVASAQARNVPIISAKQAYDWTDGRNNSRFRQFGWSNGTVTFTLDAGAGANGLQGMLPLQTAAGSLTSLTRGGSNVTFTTATLKGVQYALFTATAGSYSAHYGP